MGNQKLICRDGKKCQGFEKREGEPYCKIKDIPVRLQKKPFHWGFIFGCMAIAILTWVGLFIVATKV